ncbi:uncharacterized protein LOC8069857 [Sorghum bicolor]|uniref:uncharacterized protein LOC8069857 n=1 Tax=Sorghum bicolor TaxID=4558 RepID=UPI000B424D33|nr:uncharacterized protein LOC8069857 [Sorghum bicolor]|eukprot:XP_021321308.1 uncharacterized protein LOC8069857 [Sorghum bicolor]
MPLGQYGCGLAQVGAGQWEGNAVWALRDKSRLSVEATTVQGAVREIICYLEDTGHPNQVIYFDGWHGLGASAVLASIAEEPPLSLRSRFDLIIHIDCFKWKNRRQLQRTIAQKLNLPQQVMSIFERQDEDDDFGGVDEGSRGEIREVRREIHRALQGKSYFVVFHNRTDTMVDFYDFGIPPAPAEYPWSNIVGTVLWTFRGRLRSITSSMEQEATPYRYVYEKIERQFRYLYSSKYSNSILLDEAAEIIGYTKNKVDFATSEILHVFGIFCPFVHGYFIDFNWATHASNYWVCDGIIQRQQQVEAWNIATALREEIRLEDYSWYDFQRLVTLHPRWKVLSSPSAYTDYLDQTTTSFFCSDRRGDEHQRASLPDKMFQRADNLHVLKLCHCTFNFSLPPFLCCKNLRFLGLDSCKDQPQRVEEINQQEDEEEHDYCRQTTEFFQSLWVLDISCTDWELSLSPNTQEKTATSIREINIKRGRIWHKSHAWTWRHLHNIHKLRVIEPTCPWETGNMDELSDMVKLELLDLTGNSTIQVLPSLSGAIGLKTLVLDGCVGMEHVGPQSFPPCLETFSFDAGEGQGHDKEAKISRISMAGCVRLVKFRLGGYLPNLEELDLSSTSLKALDLKDELVQAPCLQQVILLGCQQLRAVLWPKREQPNSES